VVAANQVKHATRAELTDFLFPACHYDATRATYVRNASENELQLDLFAIFNLFCIKKLEKGRRPNLVEY